MRITVINGSERRGSTYNIAKLLASRLLTADDDIVMEFFLPRDISSFCAGCFTCFSKGETFCPHAGQVEPIHRAIVDADVVVFTTPVYAMRASGQMKALLDHFSYLFMTHRPEPAMFSKIAVIISTGAGGGTRGAMKDIAVSLKFWGMAKIYQYGAAVFAGEWSGVSDKKKARIDSKINALADKIRGQNGRVKPGLSTKVLFNAFRVFHHKMNLSDADNSHWEDRGWLGSARPWKKK